MVRPRHRECDAHRLIGIEEEPLLLPWHAGTAWYAGLARHAGTLATYALLLLAWHAGTLATPICQARPAHGRVTPTLGHPAACYAAPGMVPARG